MFYIIHIIGWYYKTDRIEKLHHYQSSKLNSFLISAKYDNNNFVIVSLYVSLCFFLINLLLVQVRLGRIPCKLLSYLNYTWTNKCSVIDCVLLESWKQASSLDNAVIVSKSILYCPSPSLDDLIMISVRLMPYLWSLVYMHNIIGRTFSDYLAIGQGMNSYIRHAYMIVDSTYLHIFDNRNSGLIKYVAQAEAETVMLV